MYIYIHITVLTTICIKLNTRVCLSTSFFVIFFTGKADICLNKLREWNNNSHCLDIVNVKRLS